MVTSWMFPIVSITPIARPDIAMAIARRRTLLHRGMMAKITEIMRAETNKADRALNNLWGKRSKTELRWQTFHFPHSSYFIMNKLKVHGTYVLLKKPPTELPINKQNCWAKNTQVIWVSVEFVWHCKSKIVGPRKAMQSPKLKNTLQ